MLVYTGKFIAMDGEVEVQERHVRNLVGRFNSWSEKVKRMLGVDTLPIHYQPPMQLDHNVSAQVTVGRVIGPLWLETINLAGDDSPMRLAACGMIRIIGEENIQKVNDGRWVHVSVGCDFETGKLSEVSFVPFPAAPHAALLSAARMGGQNEQVTNVTDNTEGVPMSYHEAKKRMEMYEKCRKRMMSKSPEETEEQREEKLAKMTEDEAVAMAAEHDEEEKTRLAAEQKPDADGSESAMSEQADDKDKDKNGQTNLSAPNTAEKNASDEEKMKKQVRLAKLQENNTKLSAALKTVHMAQKKATISTRLSALRSSGKVTPAEIKSLKIDEMAEKSDEVVNAMLQTFETRQPVIDPRVYGTIGAESAEGLARLARFKSKEDEVRARMSKGKAMTKTKSFSARMSETSEEEKVAEEIRNQVAATNPEMPDSQFGELHIIHKMMQESKHEEAMTKLGEFLGRVRTSDGGPAVPSEESERHLSALAEARKVVEDVLADNERLAKELQ
jgi:hypothetical protein